MLPRGPTLDLEVTGVQFDSAVTQGMPRANDAASARASAPGGVPADDRAWLGEHLFAGDALDAYGQWPQPGLIVSDGAYGVGGFPGDPRTPESLPDWYREHVEAWSKAAHPATTLWFWNTEIGWANVNGGTIRRFPVVTEVCVFYRRRLELPTAEGPMVAKQWLRYEWQRAGLPVAKANDACGVRNAATRKYLTLDWLWYFPPAEAMARLVAYANEHGRADGRPYFSIDGQRPVTGEEWSRLRDAWTHQHGLTNVWAHPPLNGIERFRSACTQPGDVLWEPFGGLCSAAVAAVEMGRDAYAAEKVSDFRERAALRLLDARHARERIERGEAPAGPIEQERAELSGSNQGDLIDDRDPGAGAHADPSRRRAVQAS